MHESEARQTAERLESYFVLALHEEWRQRPEDYRAILDALEGSPFAAAGERERRWWQYAAWLEQQLDAPVFDEAFGLRQVYIPLRAYWEERKKTRDDDFDSPGHHDRGEKVTRHVVAVEDELTTWVDTADRDDAARVISGGPGSGKSTLGRFFAAKMARRADLRVVLVPLHHFDPGDDLVRALADFASRDPFLPENLLAPESNERLLVIFDGLDELALQGQRSHEVAQAFVAEIQRTLDRENQRQLRLQVLLSGRELAIQSHASGLRRGTRVLHLLGYRPISQRSFTGPWELLAADQRDEWWRSFGAAREIREEGLPKDLADKKLGEITDQPLLNYLLALSYVRDSLDFSRDPSLNQIYADLVSAVYERGWDRRKGHPATEDLEEKHFLRILEEIALAVWHGDGRKTSAQAIQEQCRSSKLDRYLERFEKGAESGITRLLTAFYFRQSGRAYDGERTFEFTHKSFGEYLSACRIVRELALIERSLALAEVDPDQGIDETQALERWARICGPTALDQDLNRFLRAEMALRDKATCARWQKVTIRLIEHLLRQGMPMTRLDLPSYREMKRRARNAEEALLAAHSAAAWKTQEVLELRWPSKTAAGTWVHELRGQRNGSQVGVAPSCLNHLDLQGAILDLIDLARANLCGANLARAGLYRANLSWSNLAQARLDGADLTRAGLARARLDRARLTGVDLTGADLSRTRLDEAELGGANLEGVELDSMTSFRNSRGEPLAASDELLQRIHEDREG